MVNEDVKLYDMLTHVDPGAAAAPGTFIITSSRMVQIFSHKISVYISHSSV